MKFISHPPKSTAGLLNLWGSFFPSGSSGTQSACIWWLYHGAPRPLQQRKRHSLSNVAHHFSSQLIDENQVSQTHLIIRRPGGVVFQCTQERERTKKWTAEDSAAILFQCRDPGSCIRAPCEKNLKEAWKSEWKGTRRTSSEMGKYFLKNADYLPVSSSWFFKIAGELREPKKLENGDQWSSVPKCSTTPNTVTRSPPSHLFPPS